MGHECTHTSANDAVPGRQVHSVELCFYDFSDVIQNTSLLERKCNTVNCMLLHFWHHVRKFDNSVFSLGLVDASMSDAVLRVNLGLPLLSLCHSWIMLRCLFCHLN